MKPVDKNYPYTEREWKRLNEMDAEEKRGTVRLALVLVFLLAVTIALGYLVYYVVFRSHDYQLPVSYNRSHAATGMPDILSKENTAESYARNLCVTDRDVNTGDVFVEAYSVGLFDLDHQSIRYAKDIFTMRSPASITKIMTALLVLEHGNLDDMVTVSPVAMDVEYGSSVCDVRVGDRLSLKQLLYGMMVASGNDAAMVVAEHIGGSVSHFVEMMNEEALRLGATRTHCVNPHGLEDPDHYTCVYDIYLIFRAAMQYDVFMDMIHRENFYAEYTDADGDPTAITWECFNHYFTGDARSPSNVIIYGGKTGTTDEAGACLALLTRDLYGNPYLAIILHAMDKDILYDEMNSVLGLIEAP